MRHNGIKIDAAEGTPVRAAARGTVTYAAPMKYFGETVISKHNDIYSTVYSHLKKRKVRPGTLVKQGDTIGHLGRGEDGNPRLYFEIRRHNRARDPLRYLPHKK
jgi:murein DD-endopeptidase MepM/ murein hydrolase activator NlpD